MINQAHVRYVKLAADDLGRFKALIRLFENVFEMKDFEMPADSYLSTVLTRPDFLSFVAVLNNEVVGGLTAYTLHQYYRPRPLVYIFDLAVLTKYQRQGIGKNLMAAINAHCKSEGVEEVFVQADLADDYALDFYRSTGGVPEDVVHFTYGLNR
jgi:aminoglycoside 3-N-acetyltransferase I